MKRLPAGRQGWVRLLNSSRSTGSYFVFVKAMTPKLTLEKNERLKSRKAIEQLFKEGQRFTLSPFKISYLISSGKGLQFGVGAGTKNFKKAVDRNKIKRLTREAWRLQKKPLQKQLEEKNTGLSIFFIYTGKELPDYRLVYDKVDLILTRLVKLINENDTPHS